MSRRRGASTAACTGAGSKPSGGGAADHRALGVLPHRVHLQAPALASERADVTHLPAGLGVEGVLLQHQLDPWTLLAEGQHVGVGLGGVVPDEALLAPLDAAPGAGLGRVHRRSDAGPPPGGTGVAAPPPLRVEGALEPGQIDLDPPLTGDDLGQVDRKAKSVVQTERLLASDRAAAGGKNLLQSPQPALDRLQEPPLLGLGDLVEVADLGAQLGIDVAHLPHHHVGERRQRGLTPAEQPGVPHGTTEDPAQHVATAFVAGVHPVGEQEAHGARMVRQHAIARPARRPSGRRRGPPARPTRSMSGRNTSVWKLSSSPCITAAIRSSPAPVSTDGLGSG